MGTEKRLGRGLGSLLGSTRSEEAAEPHAEVPIERIQPNPHQPREHFDHAALEELRDSIERHGVLQPLVLRATDGGYELIAGERRLRAARMAGLRTVPAVVRGEVSDELMLELALVENVQRADLDPIEKARGYRRMLETLGLTQEEVAEKVGLRRSTVANHLRLLDLPAKAQEAVSAGLISMGHARALAGLEGEALIYELVERTAREGLSVRQVEDLVREKTKGARLDREGRTSKGAGTGELPWVTELERRIRAHLGAKVRLTSTPACRGRIVIEFHDRMELDHLAQILAPRPRI